MATYVWLILIGVFIILELCTFEGVMVWFALGSLLAVILSLLVVPVWIQTFAFLIVGITLMFVLGPKARKWFNKKRDKKLNKKLLGEIGVIKKILAPNVLFVVKFNKRKGVVVLKTPAPLKIGDSVKVISILNGIIMGEAINAGSERVVDEETNEDR